MPELIANYDCRTGEGPLWHPDQELLYWVDIPDGELYSYDPATGNHELRHEGDRVGGFTIQEDGELLLFGESGSIRTWSDGLVETLIPEIPEDVDSRFNDVIAGPQGRVYCGTMGGNLYCLDTDGQLRTLIEGVATPNGMGFTPDNEHMYFSETSAQRIWRYDYDPETGDLSSPEVYVDTTGRSGKPDGMTVDAEGYVWSARWNGWCVVRHDSDGQEVDRVELPARKISAITFGGPEYETAYVTTAGGEGDPVVEGEGAGGLYAAELGVSGTPEFRSDIMIR
jgi:D-xylonolactonase